MEDSSCINIWSCEPFTAIKGAIECYSHQKEYFHKQHKNGNAQTSAVVVICHSHSCVSFIVLFKREYSNLLCVYGGSDSFIYIDTREPPWRKWFIVMVFMLLELELRLWFDLLCSFILWKRILFSNVRDLCQSAGPFAPPRFISLQCILWEAEKKGPLIVPLKPPCW